MAKFYAKRSLLAKFYAKVVSLLPKGSFCAEKFCIKFRKFCAVSECTCLS